MKKILSVDAETDGLWGNPFSIAAIVYEDGKEIDKVCYRLPDDVVTDEWVKENVLPTLDFPVTHRISLKNDDKLYSNCFSEQALAEGHTYQSHADRTKQLKEEYRRQLMSKCDFEKSYQQMLKEFAEFYNKYREESTVLWHMGHIVESHLFRELHRLGFIGDWDAPYNPIEVAELLRQNGEQPDSVDNYIKKYDISINDYGSTHNPLYDCEVAAKVYSHLENN